MTTALIITTAVLNNGPVKRQLYITVLTPTTPAQASNTIIYDPTTTPWTNSAAYVATKIRSVKTSSSIQGASGTNASCYLTWDASTPVAAWSIPCNSQNHVETCLDEVYNPLPNQGGSGVTGKIGITTNGLVAGDTITILLDLING